MNLGEELIPQGEVDAIDRVVAVSVDLMDQTARPVPRGQHPKHHGCVRAEFIVEPDLPPKYRVGLFKEAKTFPAWIRFSNGGQKDGRKPDAHGMAIKLMEVPGEKILDEEKHEQTHDFVMVDNPVFFLRNALDYGVFSDALRKAKGKAPSLIRSSLFFLPGKLRELGTVAMLFFLPWRLREFSRLTKFLGKRIANPLETQYWSTTPYRFGSNAAMKFSAKPEVVNTTPKGESENYLREAMIVRLKNREASFEFQVQLQTDPKTMPVEDPTVPWNASFKTVAKVRIFSQRFDTFEQMEFCENLSFTPWHALPEHRPLGGINRTREKVYTAISKRRHELNQAPRTEPTPASTAHLGQPWPTSGRVLDNDRRQDQPRMGVGA